MPTKLEASLKTVMFVALLSLPVLGLPCRLISQTVTIGRVEVIRKADCPSGYAFEFSDAIRCIEKNKKVKFESLIGITQKYAYYSHKLIKVDGNKIEAYKLVSVNPQQDAGQTYEIPHGLSFLDVVGALAAGVNSANGVYTPPPSYTPPPPTVPVAVHRDIGKDYTRGVNECVTWFYNSTNFTKIFSYKNNCSQAVSIRYVANNGSGGQMDLSPGETGGTGDEPSMMVGKVYDLFVCPRGYIAVDENDQYINRPMPRFNCRSRGY